MENTIISIKITNRNSSRLLLIAISREENSRERTCLREFDSGGSGDDGVSEELRNKGKQAILLRKLTVAKSPQRTAEIDSQDFHLCMEYGSSSQKTTASDNEFWSFSLLFIGLVQYYYLPHLVWAVWHLGMI